MRLVGIEPHPLALQTAQLATYECRCGKIIVEPEFVGNGDPNVPRIWMTKYALCCDARTMKDMRAKEPWDFAAQCAVFIATATDPSDAGHSLHGSSADVWVPSSQPSLHRAFVPLAAPKMPGTST